MTVLTIIRTVFQAISSMRATSTSQAIYLIWKLPLSMSWRHIVEVQILLCSLLYPPHRRSGGPHAWCRLFGKGKNFFLLPVIETWIVKPVAQLLCTLLCPGSIKFGIIILKILVRVTNDHGGTVVKALCYKSVDRWFDSRWCHWNFPLT